MLQIQKGYIPFERLKDKFRWLETLNFYLIKRKILCYHCPADLLGASGVSAADLVSEEPYLIYIFKFN